MTKCKFFTTKQPWKISSLDALIALIIVIGSIRKSHFGNTNVVSALKEKRNPKAKIIKN